MTEKEINEKFINKEKIQNENNINNEETKGNIKSIGEEIEEEEEYEEEEEIEEKKEEDDNMNDIVPNDEKIIHNNNYNNENFRKLNQIDNINIVKNNNTTNRNKVNEKDINSNDNNEFLDKINELEKTLNEKDKIIKNLINKNSQLRDSLVDFSKKLDKQISKNKTNKRNINNNINDINKVKDKELDNAIHMVKFLRNDTQRLQKIIEENKIKLENEKREYQNILEANNKYKIKIQKLEEKNKKLFEENVKLKKNINEEQLRTNLKLLIDPKVNETDNLNKDKEIQKNNNKNVKTRQINIKLYKPKNSATNNSCNLQKSSSLPKIKIKNLNIKKEENEKLKNIFNDEEISKIKNSFMNDKEFYDEFINKINILNKSKETLNKKYNYEIKMLTERISSMQKQIKYLEIKIKEKDIQLKISKSEINQNIDINKQLIKKLKQVENNNNPGIVSINENNLDEIDTILNNLDKNNNINYNKLISFEKEQSNYSKSNEKNNDFGKEKKYDNKIFIKIVKK